ncbi:GNAT family N-acetyltransferase [Actinotalea subterranea]|uniref:GNAT family N-acetyltransferase n=1 Tax=Actinotalea subterranea TaxID=2607497 RepID=UPI0011EBE138|nr:GNAT family N-acetyltransferase [Actinotalea subterranea]
MSTDTVRQLPGGLVLRAARPADLEQVAALLAERGEPEDAVDLRLAVEDPALGWDACGVVVDGDRVVSTATLLDETVRVGDVWLPAGQVELVATDTAYEGRGLVRALMGWAHDRSAERGHLLQVMIGIPYFYRLFGYEYAIDIPPARFVDRPSAAVTDVPELTAVADDPGLAAAAAVVEELTAAAGAAHASTSEPAPPTAGHADPPGAERGPAQPVLRRAVAADLPALARLQARAQSGFDVAMPHPEARQRWLLEHEASVTWVLDVAGEVLAAARTSPPGSSVVVAEAAALDMIGAEDLLVGLAREFPGSTLRAVHRPGTATGDAWEARMRPAPDRAEQYYARIPAPEAVLDALRPVLHARLVESGVAHGGRDVVVSTFGRHYRMAVTDAGLGPVHVGGPMQDPAEQGAVGVAPDQLPALLLGPLGLRGLGRIRPDVYAGRADAPRYEALFPPLTADLLTYYLPW